MIAAEIAAALGSACRSGDWWRCRCPVHGSRGFTLALRDGDRGLIVNCHGGCDRGEILAELRRRGLVGGQAKYRSQLPLGLSDIRDRDRRIEIARNVWSEARDARGSAVERYLAGRGITTPPPLSLRWARSLRRLDGTYAPAMIARVDGVDGELIGVHRTYLARDNRGQWHRRDRASLGPVGGGAVQLAPAGELLMVAEGIETALSAMQACVQPAWAALSTSGMATLVLPATVRTVIILADNDANGAGERAARAAADRWLAEDRCVRLAMPPEPGSDFNDVLVGRAYPCTRKVADGSG
jgi:hypothetical protein